MVVGGLPERNPTHAECVANQALDMMHYCQQVKRPDTDEPIVVSTCVRCCCACVCTCKLQATRCFVHYHNTHTHTPHHITHARHRPTRTCRHTHTHAPIHPPTHTHTHTRTHTHTHTHTDENRHQQRYSGGWSGWEKNASLLSVWEYSERC